MVESLKGNLIVGQSGGCTAAINSSLVGIVEEAMQHPEIENIYGMLHGVEGLLAENFIDLRRESDRTLRRLAFTPSASLGSCRYKLTEADFHRIVHILKAYNVRYFVYIGGNDSADTSHRIAKIAQEMGYELRVIGVPKTIDNDLPITDHCPGYGSAARFIAIATMDAGLDTECMRTVDPIKIIETMGRNAGWLAAASALGKRSEKEAPHLIYLPERGLTIDKFMADVEEVYRRLGHAVIVVAEAIKDEKGRPVGQVEDDIFTDSFGHKRLTGASQYLCSEITRQLKLKARWDKPGTIQRVSSTSLSRVDLAEAHMVGREAVRQAIAGEHDRMVVLVRESGPRYSCTTSLAPLEWIANREKLLPPEYITPEGNFVTQEFIRYAQPLIGGPLPRHARLNKHLVPKRLAETVGSN